MQQQKMRSEEDEEKASCSQWTLNCHSLRLDLRCSVWTVNKINRLRNQSTHSWKGIYSATATARWFTYLLSLCAVDVVESFFSLRVLVSPTLLKLSAARHNNGFVILFHWKPRRSFHFNAIWWKPPRSTSFLLFLWKSDIWCSRKKRRRIEPREIEATQHEELTKWFS